MKNTTMASALSMALFFSLGSWAQTTTPSTPNTAPSADIKMASGSQTISRTGNVTLTRDISTPSRVKIKKAYEVLERRCVKSESIPVRTCGYSSYCGGGFPRTVCRLVSDRYGRTRRVCHTTRTSYNYCCWNNVATRCSEYMDVPQTRYSDIKIKFKGATSLKQGELETFELIHIGNGEFDLSPAKTLSGYDVKKGGFLKGSNSFTVKGVK